MCKRAVLSKTARVISVVAVAALPFTAMANPDRDNDEQVDDVTVSAPGIQVQHVSLKIINNAKSALNAVVGTTHSSMKINLQGSVKCAKKTYYQPSSSVMHFGLAHRNSNGGLNQIKSLHTANFATSVTAHGGSGVGWITEGAPDADFSVPFNKIKNGPPDVTFDPVVEFNKKMDAFVDGGGSKADFLRNDRSFTVKRMISLSAMCRKNKHPFIGGFGAHNIFVDLRVNYKGDPDIKGGVQPLAQNGQIQAAFLINSAEAVSVKKNPAFNGPSKMKFRVTIKASGKGQVKYRLIDHQGAKSPIRTMNFNNNGTKHWYFEKDVCQSKQGVGGFQANQQQPKVGGIKANNPGGHSWRVQVLSPSAKLHGQKTYSWSCVNPKLGGGGMTIKKTAPPKTRLKLKSN